MKTLLEQIIPHVGSWLAGIAGILIALAQIMKARRPASTATAAPARASATRASEEQAMPPATARNAWRTALWRELRPQAWAGALQLLSVGWIIVENPPVSSRVVMLGAFNVAGFFFTFWSAFRLAEQLRERWPR